MTCALPVLLATLMAYGTARTCRVKSLYDTVLSLKRLPFLPELDISTETTVGEACVDNATSRLSQLLVALQRYPNQRLPFVSDATTMTLRGTVNENDLMRPMDCRQLRLNRVVDAGR